MKNSIQTLYIIYRVPKKYELNRNWDLYEIHSDPEIALKRLKIYNSKDEQFIMKCWDIEKDGSFLPRLE